LCLCGTRHDGRGLVVDVLWGLAVGEKEEKKKENEVKSLFPTVREAEAFAE
jgi:hypothetical protein